MKDKEFDQHKLDELYAAILKLETVNECRNFFRDLCTLEELQDMADRWQVARMINKHIPYRDIAKKTRVSTATITRVAQWLYNGKGGYQTILKRI